MHWAKSVKEISFWYKPHSQHLICLFILNHVSFWNSVEAFDKSLQIRPVRSLLISIFRNDLPRLSCSQKLSWHRQCRAGTVRDRRLAGVRLRSDPRSWRTSPQRPFHLQTRTHPASLASSRRWWERGRDVPIHPNHLIRLAWSESWFSAATLNKH